MTEEEMQDYEWQIAHPKLNKITCWLLELICRLYLAVTRKEGE